MKKESWSSLDTCTKNADVKIFQIVNSRNEEKSLTAGGSPLWIPLIPSLRQVFPNTSKTFLYTLTPPCFANSPCNCIRVLATSAGFENVTYYIYCLRFWSGFCDGGGENQKKAWRTATHAAIPPRTKPSAVDIGRLFSVDVEVIFEDIYGKYKCLWGEMAT